MPMLDTLQHGLSRAWQLWLTHLWQATLVVLVLMVLAFALRQAPARWRHAVYLLASLKLLLPIGLMLKLCSPLLVGSGLATLLWILPESVLGLFDARTLAAGFSHSLGWTGMPNTQIGSAAGLWLLTAVWAGGVIWLLARWRRRHRDLRGLVSRAERVVDGQLALRFHALRRRVPGTEAATLWLTSDLSEPGVWGVRQPRVLLPAAMPAHLDRDELDAVLLHELSHVRRRDNLVARLHYGLCALLWFHPLVWLLDRRLLAERELACDEAVLALSAAPRSYAQGLLKVLRFSLYPLAPVPVPVPVPAPVMSSMSGGADLRLRVQRICAGRVPSARWSGRCLLAVAVLVLLLSALVPLHPSCALPWTPADQESEEVACHLDWQAHHAPPPCAGGVSTLPPVITLLGG